MKKLIPATMLWLLAMTPLACGDKPLDRGTVIDKRIDPEQTIMVTVCASYGKYGCSAWVMVPSTDDEDYLLRLQGVRGGKTVEQWRGVDAASWNDAEIGEVVEIR